MSTTLNTIAMYCIRFGVSWLIMKKTNSTVAFAFVFSASSFIEVYAKPIMSPMADYFDRLVVYRVCVVLTTVCFAFLAVSVVLWPFSIILMTIPLMLLSLIASLRDPSSAGLVPALVDARQLTSAQAMRGTTSSVVGLVGPMLSALLLMLGGTDAAFAAAFVFCSISLCSTLGVRAVRADAVTAPKPWSAYLKTWHWRTFDGVRAVMVTRSERMMAVVVALTNAGLFPFFTVVLPLWVKRGLHDTASTMAMIEVAFGVGIFFGSTLLVARLNNLLGRFYALVLGNGLLGTGLLVASFCSWPAELCVCFVLGGAGFAVFNVNASTLRAAATPFAFRSRMAAGAAFLSSFLNPFATQGMGFVVGQSSATIALALCGLMVLISTLLQLKNIDAKSLLLRTNEEMVDAYQTLYPEAFIERRYTA